MHMVELVQLLDDGPFITVCIVGDNKDNAELMRLFCTLKDELRTIQFTAGYVARQDLYLSFDNTHPRFLPTNAPTMLVPRSIIEADE